ncbi:MAG TPA: GxxExxY protein [Gemmatimonadaceae bacterium]|nr:GxxExxY protein [Gemmatimonadaceae bacterium]
MATALIQGELTESVIGAFYQVYNTLGYGLLEPLYSAALAIELRARGHQVDREIRSPVEYRGQRIGWQRLDLVVNHRLIVELKATEVLAPHARRQLLSYLTATGIEVGLLLHFGPKARLFRVVHSHPSQVSAPPP